MQSLNNGLLFLILRIYLAHKGPINICSIEWTIFNQNLVYSEIYFKNAYLNGSILLKDKLGNLDQNAQ